MKQEQGSKRTTFSLNPDVRKEKIDNFLQKKTFFHFLSCENLILYIFEQDPTRLATRHVLSFIFITLLH